MYRVELPRQSEQPTFIGSWMIEPFLLCDELIEYFESNQSRQRRGEIGAGVNLKNKDSIDITISPKELDLTHNAVFKRYFESVLECYRDYVDQWPFLETFAKELHIGRFNLQRYRSGQHYQKIHTERAGLATLHRIFVWMTYLNDVAPEDGGATIFQHYDLSIQPRKGLTLIWPAEWTHAHKGDVLHGNSKYIVTGWMHFPD